MASTDAHAMPRKNAAARITFPIFDADGDLVTGATGLDSEVSIDGGAFADCTNEATEIGSSGWYYLDLTSGEMNGDTIIVQTKTTSVGAKTAGNVIYPVDAGDIDVNVTHFGGTALTASGGRPEVNVSHLGGSAVDQTGGLINANMKQISGDAGAADNLEQALDDTPGAVRWFGIVDQGTAQSVTGTTIRLRSAATFADNELIGSYVYISSATLGTGQVRQITGYVGSTDTATVDAWATTPTGTVFYIVFAGPGSSGLLKSDVRAAVGLASANLDTQLDALPTNAELATALGTADDAVLAAIAALNNLSQANIRTAIGLATANMDTQLAALQSDTDDIQTRLPAALTANGNMKADALRVSGTVQTAGDLAALLTTIAGYIDTEVAAIKAVTDALPNSGALTTIQADLDDIQTRIPAALVSGRMDASVGAVAANAITAAALAADAGAEIADAVWDEDATGHQTQGTFGQAIGDPVADTNTIFKAVVTDASGANVAADIVAVKAETASIQSDTDDIQSRIPTALVGGKIDANVGTISNNAITAASMNADASAEIADAVWDEDATGHQTQGSFGQAIGDPVADTNTLFKAVVTDAAGANVAADIIAVKAETASIQSDTDNIQTRIPAALVGGRIDASVAAAGLATDAAQEIADTILTRQMTEAYAADGVAPTVAEMLFMLWSALADYGITSTTMTARKLDGTTTAMTFTLNDPTNPTDRTRAT